MKKGLLAGFAMIVATSALVAELTPSIERAFSRYVATRENTRESSLTGDGFLWIDQYPDLVAAARSGEAVIRTVSPKNPVELPGGLAHDWIGTVFIPGTTLKQTLAFVQDYANHKNTYRPEVVDSRLVSHQGNDFHTFLRLRKHKVITVLLNSEHDVKYTTIDARRAYSRSVSTKIAEVENPGTPDEHELAPADDHGFLWKLNSYWRFEERDGGVWVECEAISLTRDIPFGLGAIVKPIIRDLPAESLEKTLRATSAALSKQ